MRWMRIVSRKRRDQIVWAWLNCCKFSVFDDSVTFAFDTLCWLPERNHCLYIIACWGFRIKKLIVGPLHLVIEHVWKLQNVWSRELSCWRKCHELEAIRTCQVNCLTEANVGHTEPYYASVWQLPSRLWYKWIRKCRDCSRRLKRLTDFHLLMVLY